METDAKTSRFNVAQTIGVLREQEVTRADPHPIGDFFIADLIDYAPKDSAEMMERPFFSIAKRKRNKPIHYETSRPQDFGQGDKWQICLADGPGGVREDKNE